MSKEIQQNNSTNKQTFPSHENSTLKSTGYNLKLPIRKKENKKIVLFDFPQNFESETKVRDA